MGGEGEEVDAIRYGGGRSLRRVKGSVRTSAGIEVGRGVLEELGSGRISAESWLLMVGKEKEEKERNASSRS